MEIEIRFHGVDRSPAFAQHARRRIEHFLGRLGREVTRVVLRVTDVNGPRGGADKRCQLTISGPELGTVILVEARGDVYSAAELALYRARRVLGEDLERRRAEEARTVRRGAVRLRLLPGTSG